MKKISSFAVCVGLLLPSLTLARHNDDRISTSGLDDDIVESFPVPILFGDYSDMEPNFGDPRGGGTRTHEGHDMMAPEGTPIVSPTEAVVTGVGEGPSAGLYVYTANPGGERFSYMHLASIANIKRGDRLDVGDFIGTVGDTGNAGAGVYHLHFETRGSDGYQDPLPRLTDTFTLKEKMEFVERIFDDRTIDDDEYAEFLVATWPAEFRAALNAKYDLPAAIEEVLEDKGVVAAADRAERLAALIRSLPTYLVTELTVGADGPIVQLLQIYLIYTNEGSRAAALAAAGPTGYYGPVTAAAVAELQAANGVAETGVWNSVTRAAVQE